MDSLHPDRAFQFRAETPSVVNSDDDAKPRKFSGVAYSGKPLKHGYWGNVVFDLSETKANPKTPVLVDHQSEKRCGFCSLTFGGDITIEDGTLLDNDEGRAIAAESDAGFPWQMSVYIQPGRIERIEPGAQATVNGHSVSGPATIFRDNFIREVSFTPTGVDWETTAEALSAAAGTAQTTTEETTMTLEELQEQVASLQASVQAAEQRATEAEARAETAEQALSDHKTQTRMSAVRELFSAIGEEYSDEAAAPYLAMDDTAFSAVSDRMKGLAQQPGSNDNAQLFSEQATGGRQADGDNGEAFAIDTNEIYARMNGAA